MQNKNVTTNPDITFLLMKFKADMQEFNGLMQDYHKWIDQEEAFEELLDKWKEIWEFHTSRK